MKSTIQSMVCDSGPKFLVTSYLCRLVFCSILGLILLFFCSLEPQGKKNYWKILQSVKLTSAVVKETEFLYLKPKFSPKVKRLDGKQISIEGYLLKVGHKAYVLTRYLSSRGQLRSLGPGPKETISLEISPLVSYKKYGLVQVKGKFKLNYNNPKKAIYGLEDIDCLNCELVKISTVKD